MRRWLIRFIVDIIKALFSSSPEKFEDGVHDPERKRRLRDKIRRKWGIKILPILAVVFLGCASRTVYIQSGETVRLRETIQNADVWILDKNGTPTEGTMNLPEGWFCLPDEGAD